MYASPVITVGDHDQCCRHGHRRLHGRGLRGLAPRRPERSAERIPGHRHRRRRRHVEHPGHARHELARHRTRDRAQRQHLDARHQRDRTFAPPPPAPVGELRLGQEAGKLTVDFTDTSTNTPTNWTWDFGDGTSSTVQSPTHTYASAADYQVTLTASNGGGPTSRTKTVTVDALSGATIYAADSFGRTTSNGWSNADTGGAYTIQNNAANYSVGSGVGSMTVPNSGGMRSAFLNTVSDQDVDISFSFSVDKAPAGGAYWVYAAARRNGNNEYRIKVHVLANGSVLIRPARSSTTPSR